MFTFTKSKIVRRKVTFSEPRDGEGANPVNAYVTLEILPDDGKSSPIYDKAFFKRAVKNIEEVLDQDGKSIPFTPEFLEDFLSVQWIMAGLVREYVNLTVAAGRGN